jgi:Domain of unknown function (DUF4157)
LGETAPPVQESSLVSVRAPSLAHGRAPPWVQRTCACGGSPGLDGECEQCRQRRLQRAPLSPEPSEPRPIVRRASAGACGPLTGAGGRSPTATSHSFGDLRIAVSSHDDPLEREANSLSGCVATGETATVGTPSATVAAREALHAPGRPLDHAPRALLEGRFGQSFGDVRVHDGFSAARAAAALGADAFAVGSDLVFGAGAYRPASPDGQRLLVHEAVHVLQERRSASPALRRAGAGNCARVMESVDEQRDELSLAGRIAHEQVQGFFVTRLSGEVPVPRATKAARSVACPPSGIPAGRVDLWLDHGGAITPIKVGEIKSFNGRHWAAPEVDHYLRRLREIDARFRGDEYCPRPLDAADREFDRRWMQGRLSRRRHAGFGALDEVVPADRGAELGPFWGDPLRKSLKCRLDPGGAVVYWCVNRNLSDEELERERERLRIPVGEWGRRTEVRPGLKRPRLIDTAPGFEDPVRKLPPMRWSPERRLIVIAAEPFFREVVGAENKRRMKRLLGVDPRRSPIYAYRTLTWGTLAATLSPALVAIAGVAIATAAPVVVSAVGAAAAAGGATVVPIVATPATAEALAAAAAVVIVAGSLIAGESEAQAATHVRAAMENPRIMTVLDVTDAVGTLTGGSPVESHITFDDAPYRVVARLIT